MDNMIRSYYHAPDVSEGSMPMRGDDEHAGYMFSYLSPEQRVPADHPLRPIRRLTDAMFDRLSPRFDPLYSDPGPAVDRCPSDCCWRCWSKSLYSVRSEWQLMEQLNYNMLFRLVCRAQYG